MRWGLHLFIPFSLFVYLNLMISWHLFIKTTVTVTLLRRLVTYLLWADILCLHCFQFFHISSILRKIIPKYLPDFHFVALTKWVFIIPASEGWPSKRRREGSATTLNKYILDRPASQQILNWFKHILLPVWASVRVPYVVAILVIETVKISKSNFKFGRNLGNPHTHVSIEYALIRSRGARRAQRKVRKLLFLKATINVCCIILFLCKASGYKRLRHSRI